jgi:PIN domain nuclease of toxin-antitoxin system
LSLLLDTHLVLWWMAGEPSRIGKKALAALGSDDAEPIVSVATIWEAAIKRALGKLEAPPDLLAQLEEAGVRLLPIAARHADLVGFLPLHHRDPFDRLLVAQATVEGLPLVSDDESLRRYDIELLW